MKKTTIISAISIIAITVITTLIFLNRGGEVNEYNGVEIINGSQKYITGTIYDMTDGRVLVAEGINNRNDLSSPDNFIGNAGWFTITEKTQKDELQIGLVVEVWVSGPVLESYPVQAAADRIIVITNDDREDSGGSLITSARGRATIQPITPTDPSNSPGNSTAPTPTVKCYQGGCSGEICSSQEEVISTCELIPGMECLKVGASCQLVAGDCRWVLNEESARCFLQVKEQYGEEVTQSRIGYLFQKAEEFSNGR